MTQCKDVQNLKYMITMHDLRRLASMAVVLGLLVVGGCTREDGAPIKKQSAESPDAAAAPESPLPYYRGLIEEYRSILAEDPHNLAAIIALGNALYDAGQWKGAIHYYERALQIDPHAVDVMTDMGTCYRNLGLPDKAIDIYLRANAIEPSHQNTLFNLGIVYGEDKKDYLRAIAYWKQLIDIAPKHPQADNIKATIHMYKQTLRKHVR